MSEAGDTVASAESATVKVGEQMMVWRDDVPTSGTVELPPDPRAMDGLGRNHTLESALADIIDNSVDAGATDVLIRIVRRDGKLRALYVADNGRGMAPEVIDTAMTVGGRRDYSASDLGHFGLGMKAASFSQARSLTVMSKAAQRPAVGRRWELAGSRRSFQVDVVTEEFAERELGRDWGMPTSGTGTVVRWDGVTGFPVTDTSARVEGFVSQTVQAVSNHLGMIFHRLLENDRVRLALDVEDVEKGTGPRFAIKPVNPFGYRRSGHAGYPKTLIGQADGMTVALRCHIWNRSSAPEFKLPDGPERRQGLYIYRRNRLLQAGGDWGGIGPSGTAAARRLQLARVSVDIDNDILRLFTMNSEKSRVIVGPEFTHLAEKAVAEDGTTLATYLADAEETFHSSNKRERKRKAMLPPGRGFAPALRRMIEDEVPCADESLHIDIKWTRFDTRNDDDFFEVDRDQHTLWLNGAYRAAVLGGRRGGLNDAPLLKALLYLLIEEVFQGEYLGSRDRDNIELWQEILTAAAKSEG